MLYESTMEYPNALINKFGLLMSGDLSSVFRRLIEFELEHKKFMKQLHGHNEYQRQAYLCTMKTLQAIKERDQKIVKDHLDQQIKRMFGIALPGQNTTVVNQRKKQMCIDIFQDTQVGGYNMYEQQSQQDALKYRVRRSLIERQLNKIKLILQMGNLQGTFYLRTRLKKIELVKHLFVLDIEQDQEVYIPRDLSQKDYPLNFQFYDPIIQIIWSYMSAEKQQYFSLKTQFNIDLSINENWKLKMMNIFGSDRQAHKNPIVNSEDISDLDHTRS